jgi:hypothetical protein
MANSKNHSGYRKPAKPLTLERAMGKTGPVWKWQFKYRSPENRRMVTSHDYRRLPIRLLVVYLANAIFAVAFLTNKWTRIRVRLF